MADNAASKGKTVASPTAVFNTLQPLWLKSRAVCSGERFVKEYDSVLDPNMFTNLLLPFSPSMTPLQYRFYKAEAELPGIVAQFAKMLIGGLLRKQPILSLPDDAPEDAQNWIISEFSSDDSPMTAFLDTALWEEIQTSNVWIHVDYPSVSSTEDMTPSERNELKPFPNIWDAESVINWRSATDAHGRAILNRVIKRGYVEVYDDAENEFHPKYVERIWVHELDEQGYYQIRIFDKRDDTQQVVVVAGKVQKNPVDGPVFTLVETISNILMNGERLRFLPIWPLNGSVEGVEPMLMPIIDKEIALYNKMSRRNHLLYGAATYTPWISSEMNDTEFTSVVENGLGTWLNLGIDDKIGVLATPTDALKDMESAIAANIEEMAKLGIRMLAPEDNSDQSGIALEIRNAAQTAQLGTLNNKVSNVMAQVIAFMINWRYGLDYKPSDIDFSLSADFNPLPLGADWLRLATEWYQEGLIPRSIWIMMLKQNDLVPPDYDDEEGVKEISADEIINNKEEEMDYANKLANQAQNI